MSLHTTYASPCEIHVASEIYPHNLVLKRYGDVILQPNDYLEERLIFRFKFTDPMMNAHFAPHILLEASSLPSNVADIILCTSFVSGSTVKPECCLFELDSLSGNT